MRELKYYEGTKKCYCNETRTIVRELKCFEKKQNYGDQMIKYCKGTQNYYEETQNYCKRKKMYCEGTLKYFYGSQNYYEGTKSMVSKH